VTLGYLLDTGIVSAPVSKRPDPAILERLNELATHKPPERKIRMIPRSRSGHDDAAIENRLNAIERGLVDQRLEIAAG